MYNLYRNTLNSVTYKSDFMMHTETFKLKFLLCVCVCACIYLCTYSLFESILYISHITTNLWGENNVSLEINLKALAISLFLAFVFCKILVERMYYRAFRILVRKDHSYYMGVPLSWVSHRDCE